MVSLVPMAPVNLPFLLFFPVFPISMAEKWKSMEQALISINTGLNNQLTGLENINVKGALLGLTKKRIREITDGVIEFAELGDFLYQPVKNTPVV